MKKLISILLVAMLIIGMFPATALTAFAAEVEVTLSFADKAQRTSFNTSKQVWEQNGIKLTNDKSKSTSNVADYAKPARFYKSSKITIEYVQEITKIVFNCNTTSYATAMKNSIKSGGTVTVSGKAVTVLLTTPATSFVIEELSGGQVRVDSMAIYYAADAACAHANVAVQQDGKPATCTEPGIGNSTKCVDCGATTIPGETIPALGHEYADGACANCEKAMVDPNAPTATLLTQLPGIGDTVAIYYPVESLAMTATADGSRLAPVLAELQDGKMPYNDDVAQLTFGAEGEYYTFANADGQYLVTTGIGNNLSFTEELTDEALWSITASGTNTWNITSKSVVNGTQAQAIEYYNGFTTYGISSSKAEYRMALYLIAESVCEHTNKTSQEDGFDATCTEAGQEDSYVCDDCGANFPGATIDPLGHNYVNGVCSGCGAEKPAGMTPATTLVSGEYVIVAVDEEGNYALPLEIDTKMNGTAVTVDADGVLTGDDLPVWTVEVTDAGITLYNGEQYLGYASSTNLGAKDTAFTWTATAQDGAFVIKDAGTSDRCVIFQVRDTQDRFRFGAYKTGQTSGKYIEALAFYKVGGEEVQEPVVEMDGVKYNSFEEAYAEDPDTTIKLLAPIENINVTGDLYLDLNGFTASVDGANAIFAGDSSATTAKAGTGVLTTTANVETVETIGSTRYVALKGENNQYTFHALEMKLTAVSLRTSAAGVYYKAEMICDAELKAATACHGVVVSVDGMPGADFATVTDKINAWTAIEGAPAEGNMTSCSVFGIFKDGKENNAERGEMKIYARAYLQLKDTNEIVMSSNSAAKSLKDVMEEVNGKFATLEDADQKNLINFFKKWESAMVNWNVDNIADAADAAN